MVRGRKMPVSSHCDVGSRSWSSFPQTSILECGGGPSIGSQNGVKRVQ